MSSHKDLTSKEAIRQGATNMSKLKVVLINFANIKGATIILFYCVISILPITSLIWSITPAPLLF